MHENGLFLKMLQSTKVWMALLLISIAALNAHWAKIALPYAPLSNPPSEQTAKLLGFQDQEFAFRLQALRLQNAGDGFGRLTSLREYDYVVLGAWLKLLSALNADSDWVPAMAAYYFGLTPHSEDIRVVVDYLEHHAKQRPEARWWWLMQASYLAQYRMKDLDRAFSLMQDAAKISAAPLWVKQMPAFLLEQRGEKEAAAAVMQGIMQKSPGTFSDTEMRFMQYYLKERVGTINPKR